MSVARIGAFASWKAMGSPQQVTREQYAALERAAGMGEAVAAINDVRRGGVTINFTLPRQGVTLLRLETIRPKNR